MLSRFSHVKRSVTLWTVAHQAPLSVGFFRQEYWCGLPCPCPGDLPDPGIEPISLMSPCIGSWVLYHHCHLKCLQLIFTQLSQKVCVYMYTHRYTKQMWQKVTIWHEQKTDMCSLYYSFNCFGKLKIFPNVKFKKIVITNQPKVHCVKQIVQWQSLIKMFQY